MNSDDCYDRLMLIRNTEGANAKLKALPNDELFKMVLRYALNPYWPYHFPNINFGGYGDKHFDEWTWRLLDVLTSRKLTGNKAKQTIANHASLLTVKSAELLKMIISKKLRIGVGVPRVNQKFPDLIPEFRVNPVDDYTPGRLKYPFLAGPKLDGTRTYIKGGRILSKRGKPLVGLEHIKNGLDLRYDYEGETILPGVNFYEANGLINGNATTPSAIFNCFDMPTIQAPLSVRYLTVKQAPHYIDHTLIRNDTELDYAYKQCIAYGYEGIVLKDPDAYYMENRWYRQKPLKTADLKVVGTYDGKLGTKYNNMLGGIIVDFKGKEVRVGGGISDMQRVKWYIHPELIMNKTVEIHYKDITNKGSLREPRLKWFRYDKED